MGYAAASLAFYTAVAAGAEGLNRALFGAGHPFCNPFSLDVLRGAATYLVVQSMFLLGSLWFRRMAFIKTWLAQCVHGILFAVLVWLAGRILSADLPWNGLSLGPNTFGLGPDQPVAAAVVARAQPYLRVLEVIFWAMLAPVCWVASWLRLGEAEV